MSDYVSREDHEDRVAQINAHRMDLQDRIETLSAEISKWHTVTRAHLDRIEAQAAEIERLNETVRRVQAAARTLETTRCEIYQHYVENSKINAAAVSTLDSEREANALLTADIEAQAAEIVRLREALEFYAGWGVTNPFYDSVVILDRGKEARAALGGNDE